MIKNLIKKKFYFIALTNLESKILVIFDIKIIAKLGNMIH